MILPDHLGERLRAQPVGERARRVPLHPAASKSEAVGLLFTSFLLPASKAPGLHTNLREFAILCAGSELHIGQGPDHKW